MQFLRATTQYARIQKAALWSALKPKSFLRQYMLANIFSKPLSPHIS